MKNLKTIALILSLIMVIGCYAYAEEVQLISAEAKDYEGHWAQDVIEKWLGAGKVSGYPDGTYKPDNNVTRAEFVKMINGIIDFNQKGQVTYKDVPSTEWFYEYIGIAQEIGYISGYSAEKFGPNDYITREQAASILARVQYLNNNATGTNKFTDKTSITAWAVEAVGAASEAGFVSGYTDGSFKPLKNLTRAEALTMIDNVLVNAKNYVIYKDKTELKDTVINGDLIIAKTVGEGDVYLTNVTINGEIKVFGGGMNSVYFNNVKIAKIVVEKEKVRLVFQNDSKVQEVVVTTETVIENEDGTISKITVTGENEVTLSGSFAEVAVTGNSNLVLNEAEITKLVVEQPIVIQGTGTVATLQANANGITFEADVEIEKTTLGTGVTEEPAPVEEPIGGGGGGGGFPGPIEENPEIVVTIAPPDDSPMALNTVDYTNDDTIYEAVVGIINDDAYKSYITGKLNAYVTKLNYMQVDTITGISAIWDKTVSYLPENVKSTVNGHKSKFTDGNITISELTALLNVINNVSDNELNQIIENLENDQTNINNLVFMYNDNEVTYSITETGNGEIQLGNIEIAKLILTDILKSNMTIGDFFEKYGKLTITSTLDTNPSKTATISIETK